MSVRVKGNQPMHSRVSYEICRTRGGFYVLRIVAGEETVIDRFDHEHEAVAFVAFLNHIAEAPRRLAMH
jgi:hypothetical protein